MLSYELFWTLWELGTYFWTKINITAYETQVSVLCILERHIKCFTIAFISLGKPGVTRTPSLFPQDWS